MSSYTHFTLNERKYLQELLEKGYGVRAAARALGRAPSSVSRELKRNSSKAGNRGKNSYHHWRANALTVARRRQKRSPALPVGSEIRAYVEEKLSLFWSPEQIAGRWKLEHPGATLCFATIYRYIRSKRFVGIHRKTHLRRRGKHRFHKDSDYSTIHPDRLIPQWPSEIQRRERIGDWEGDTVYGAVGKGLIVTLVDRKSRYLCAGLLPSRNAELTCSVIHALLKDLPVKSISLDNGSEFAQFRTLEDILHVPVFFAEPHKPWQRGTNENTNDILRFFFPKGCDFHAVSPDLLRSVVLSINLRPRKSLGWLSPHEVFFSVALT